MRPTARVSSSATGSKIPWCHELRREFRNISAKIDSATTTIIPSKSPSSEPPTNVDVLQPTCVARTIK
jgi:hypothetical protein